MTVNTYKFNYFSPYFFILLFIPRNQSVPALIRNRRSLVIKPRNQSAPPFFWFNFFFVCATYTARAFHFEYLSGMFFWPLEVGTLQDFFISQSEFINKGTSSLPEIFSSNGFSSFFGGSFHQESHISLISRSLAHHFANISET